MSIKYWACFFAFLLANSFVVLNAEDQAENESEDEIVTEKIVQSKKDEDTANPDIIGPSIDAQTTFLFTTEAARNRQLVAGRIVKILIGFLNRGEKDFIVRHCDASFRYPLDFSYHIQNFTTVRYDRLVQPKQEATFDYAFIPSDAYTGRPLGLVVNLYYEDVEGSYFINSVLNDTVTITEDESSFQTETYFLYMILAGFVLLILFMVQHFLSKFTRKSSPIYQPTYEVGTNKNEVDWQWIPRSHLETIKKSPKMGSPRSRKPIKSVS